MAKSKKTEVVEDPQAGIEDGVLAELLDEHEIRTRMAAITRRLPGERKRLVAATENYRERKYKIHLAACFLRDDLFNNLEAKKAVLDFKLAMQEGKSKAPTLDDKEALVRLEVGDVMLERELAEMAVKASEKDFEMLSTQQMWYQSVMRNNGPTVPIEQSVGRVYDAPDPLPNWKAPDGPDVVTPEYQKPELAVTGGLENYNPATRELAPPEPAPTFTPKTSVASVYGGPMHLSDVREPQTEITQPEVVLQDVATGAVTPAGKDDDIPF